MIDRIVEKSAAKLISQRAWHLTAQTKIWTINLLSPLLPDSDLSTAVRKCLS